MRPAGALIRAAFLTEASYRIGMLSSLAGLVITAVPVYYIAQPIQPIIADSIANQGGQYFAFVLVGMVAINFVNSACTSLPAAFSSGIRTGTLEAVFVTPASTGALLGGMVTYPMLWTLARSIVFLGVGVALGAHFAATGVLPALLVLLLIVAAYLPFGMIGAASVLVFRTTGPMLQGVIVLSLLLGGVYYPTEVVPEQLRFLAAGLPLTYGLRALRRTLIDGQPLQFAGDIAVLVALAIGLFAASSLLLAAAMRHARRDGSLSHY